MAMVEEVRLWGLIFLTSLHNIYVTAQFFHLRGSSPYSSIGSQFTMYCNLENGGYPSAANRILFRRGDEEMCSVNVKPCIGIQSTVSDYFCSCYHGNNTITYLTIRDLTADDEADWTCSLERYNLKSDKFSLPLYHGPGESLRLMPNTDGKHTVNEGNSLPPITCTAQCKPTCHVNWYKLGDAGDLHEDATLISNDSVLYITDASKSDAGRYACLASNMIDKNSSMVFIRVNAKSPSAVGVSRLSFGVGVGVGIVVCAVVMVTGMSVGVFVYSKVKSTKQNRQCSGTNSVSSMAPIYDEPDQQSNDIFRPSKKNYRMINHPPLPAYEDHDFDLSPL